MSDEKPKLHVDSDWKAEAQAEKDRLVAEEADAGAKIGAGPGAREMPEASIRTLIEVLASQAAMGLATMQDPDTQGVMVDLDGAKFSIDLLSVIEEKTKGNLSAEETQDLTQALSGLRARWVQVKQFVDQHGTIDPAAVAGGGAGAGPGGIAGETGGGPVSGA